MPLSQQCRFEAHEIHSDKGLEEHLLLAVAFSTMQVTVRFGSIPPQEQHPAGEVRELFTSVPFPLIPRKDFQLDEYLERPHTA
ncbi:hypothetical protein TNCV_4604341 [Trichonephila clavipes]|nr:hypothetical protein TNCV_4604341 [Trichonephila clavipes]